ncbi:MAG: peptidylprolyl isomerase [Gammaproteobacteria bacterium]|uniref:peptidylprolyl isomerase n=1 Tax=Candidatus Thiopontia autotrophica TaxID=2841688 RepID=A0A8J6P0Z4_9GAMM|nr:peptidylprolyl isomerase [Candidatus Thiopontia autotrophica]MBL6968864.1 peptidylprolyl isomerase [Gammaproteobacteria bacterium]
MSETVQENKLVELTYQVLDQKSGAELTAVEFPVGYVHGRNEILSGPIMEALEGRSSGEVIEVPIEGDLLYGERDESLVITDHLENVPEDYREVGTTIIMENDKGETKNFLVTRVDEKSVTIDGNNPLCGRDLLFKLEILTVRDATEEEIELGGPIEPEPEIENMVELTE